MTRRLKALRIGNFKAFADTQRIPLKPITLIFGPNSAGKSSFIHSLALAHEAQFGTEKQGLSRLDVHHTEVGGSAIDLGGFHQYVHRGQLDKRVEWGAELKVAALAEDKKYQRLASMLAPLGTVRVNIALGLNVVDFSSPYPACKDGDKPMVESIEIVGDGVALLSICRSREDLDCDRDYEFLRSDRFHLERLASDHAVYRQALERNFLDVGLSPEEFDVARKALNRRQPELVVRVDRFLPSSVELAGTDKPSQINVLYPVDKRGGKPDEVIDQLACAAFLRTFNDLVIGLAHVLTDELKRLQYLGPLRSFPPRHPSFAGREDTNWYAGGGHAWDVALYDESVRDAVNEWLGSGRLKTRYRLKRRDYVDLDCLDGPLYEFLQNVQIDSAAHEDLLSDGKRFIPGVADPKGTASDFVKELRRSSTLKPISELVLEDQRTGLVVTHRDVGIGISQVLPVLVTAYGSCGKLLAMEQPEIHLHPALQADLGDVFIESALGERQNTFIIETHSEHLILRLMRRIREGKISPQDVGVVFVEPLAHGSHFKELRIDEDGDFIDEWPGGFFEESFHEKFSGR